MRLHQILNALHKRLKDRPFSVTHAYDNYLCNVQLRRTWTIYVAEEEGHRHINEESGTLKAAYLNVVKELEKKEEKCREILRAV